MSTLLFVTLLASCVTGDISLNSDRIERAFGSYGVDILRADESLRVSSLYSQANREKITRTYAVVEFSHPLNPAFEDTHRSIENGGSIGATFRAAGWQLQKQHLYIGEFEIPEAYEEIGTLMHLSLPTTLATHVYLLNVQNEQSTYQYATITEIHHPDYLVTDDLHRIYGEILFDDSNRNTINDFIGAPNPTK